MQIKVITTGGTIDKVYFDAKSSFEIGESVVGAILSEADVTIEVDIVPLMRKDSLELTDDDRSKILDTVQEADQEHVIITHGTDTMVQTGQVLSSVSGKTIVLVGSLQPARFRSTDALFNIGMAVAAVQSKPHGVYITMNGRVFDIDKVQKNLERNQFEPIQGE